MKTENNIDYDNKAQLETEITNLLDKLMYLDIDTDVYNGLESFRDELYLSRVEYDKARISAKKNKKQ
jgi:hypothetical protein